METSKHTPGPWKFLQAFGRVESESRVIAYLAAGVTEGSFRTTLVNGPLIAAAPELLEALEATLSEFDCVARNTTRGRHYGEAVIISSEVREKVRAAVRAARGE